MRLKENITPLPPMAAPHCRSLHHAPSSSRSLTLPPYMHHSSLRRRFPLKVLTVFHPPSLRSVSLSVPYPSCLLYLPCVLPQSIPIPTRMHALTSARHVWPMAYPFLPSPPKLHLPVPSPSPPPLPSPLPFTSPLPSQRATRAQAGRGRAFLARVLVGAQPLLLLLAMDRGEV